ncbi:unnamed protein product [Rotaria socialis]|uniref:Endonuclease n=1 Tax=Rotaria socialis TaxID=392032 RepID=A0A821F099_9BILA|nr:unnamed protein product [Rotaria socialis]CAF4644398.1 unnamed protein product [Rotaria socialis]
MPTNRSTVEQPARSNAYRPHEFDPTSCDWDDWEILFDTFIDVEGITDDNKKRNLLITALGVQPFKTLISVCKPKKPNECSYQEIIQKLRINYARVTFSSTERIKFFATRQDSSQTLTDFANSLRDKTVTCKFPNDFYENALITAFVGGLKNDHVRKHLMQQNLETFEQTLNAARIFESVLIQGSNDRNDVSDELAVMKIQKQHKHAKNVHHKMVCSSCGSPDHLRSQCRFRHVTCHKCNKEGHISKVCRSHTNTNHNKINTIASVTYEQIKEHPIHVPIKIDGFNVLFDLDTGSPITVIDKNIWIQMGKPILKPIKSVYNSFSGHAIPLKGEKIVKVNYNDQELDLQLIVGNENCNNILGRNWINALHLNETTLDELINNNKVLNVNSKITNLKHLIHTYNDIFKEGLGCCKMKAHLYVKSGVIPKFHKPRSLPFAYRQVVETNLNRLVHEGVLTSVNVAKWAAPIVIVPKPNGKVRICADFSTGVNQSLDIDQYPLPKPNDLFVVLNGGTKFSKIDFSEAYLQVELDEESKELVIINTHKGLFKFNRLPFGIASAPSIFQKIMDQMLSGLEGTVCYLDDIIVTGKTEIEHLNNLNKVFSRIKEYGFHINQGKCSFLQNSVEYLGFVIDKFGIHTSPSKIKAIVNMPKPTNVSQLRSFLGMVTHYAKFIPRLTDRLLPFYSLLKKDTSWQWTSTCDKAFKSIKRLLTSPLALTHYDPSLPLILAADASNAGVGAVIYHRFPDGTEKAIAHASKTLTSTETKYAQIEKEALAIIYGVQKFDQFLRGRQFTLLTDHKPLLTIFGPKKGIPTTSANRLQRWAIRLMGYTYKIEYCSTNHFGQADGLSRLPVGPDVSFDNLDPGAVRLVATIQEEIQKELPLRASHIAKTTRKDLILQQVYHYILSGWPTLSPEKLESYFRIRNELSTSHGCITWGIRTIIPTCFRTRLLNHLHSTHSGMGKMKAEARRYFWWPSLDKDIEDLVHQCKICSEIAKQPAKAPLQQWNVPNEPWKRIHIDFMGKFLGSYFLIVVDAHSKWLEVFMMNDISTLSTISNLKTLFARYGLCEEIISDNGTQFTSNEFTEFCARNGIRHICTSPGHPQSNGQAERYVDIVKTALKKGFHKG